jgi:hypothetical protein
MKPWKRTSILAVGLTLWAWPASTQTRANAGFDTLKTLVGDWEGKDVNGKTIRASYRLVSAGSALLETLSPPDESEMVTVYHADGSRVALTHYCSTNNQPRMRTEAVTGPTKQLAFAFAGASNLASPATGHMHGLVITLEDKDHFAQKWTWRENGGNKTEVFQFTRKK